MHCCRRRSARAAATTGVGPTPRRSPAARRRSISARRAALRRSPRSRTLLHRDALAAQPCQRRRGPQRWSRRSTRASASAAPSACRPARSMPSSAPASRCIRWSPRSARAVSCALRRARLTASRWCRATAAASPRTRLPDSIERGSTRTHAPTGAPRRGAGGAAGCAQAGRTHGASLAR